MIVKTTCPQCGAQMEIDDSKEVMFCPYCGCKVINQHEKIDVTVVHKQDRSGDPNLIIQYASSYPNVVMMVRIAGIDGNNYFAPGNEMSFHLLPGMYTIFLKIGKRNYRRIIYLPQDNVPVRISAGYAGRAYINIDQPEREEMNKILNSNPPAPREKMSKYKVMSIVAFILSFTMYGSPAAIVLAIIDLVMDKEEPHKLSVAAIIIGSVFTLSLIATLAGGSTAK